jgi:hypothetical protein
VSLLKLWAGVARGSRRGGSGLARTALHGDVTGGPRSEMKSRKEI